MAPTTPTRPAPLSDTGVAPREPADPFDRHRGRTGRDRLSGSASVAPDEGSVAVQVPLGQRAMVLGDLRLPSVATPASLTLAADVAAALDGWQGPGVVVVCGNLFEASCCGNDAGDGADGDGGDAVHQALAAHGTLTDALRAFVSEGGECGRRLLVVPGWSDPEVSALDSVRDTGAEVVGAVDLQLETAAGVRTVLVRAGAPAQLAPELQVATSGDMVEARPWLTGLDRLEDPSSSRRLVTSRLLYRRLRRYLWVPPLVVAVVALALRLPVVFSGLSKVVRRGRGHRVLTTLHGATWQDRMVYLVAGVAVLLAVVALLVAITSRGVWRALGGGALPDPLKTFRRHGAAGEGVAAPGDGADVTGLLVGDETAIDAARDALEGGATGLVVGGGLRAELVHLDRGFFASPGGTTELVREHRGRVGLPPVFLHHRQSSFLELEGGADLHVRLLLADADLPRSTMLERLATTDDVVKGYKAAADVHPQMVASWPRGASWPPAADVAASRVAVRRIRRLAAAAIFVAGLVDLLSAVTPPLRAHLAGLETVLPLGLSQAAGALVALAGIGLMMLARGVLRGQRRSWLVAVGLLSVTLVLHLVHSWRLSSLLVSALVLVFLLVQRDRFRASADPQSGRSAFLALGIGVVAATVAATVAVEVSGRVRHHPLPSWPLVLWGSAERLVGVQSVVFPARINEYAAHSLTAVGIALVVVTVYLLTRPVVDRRLSDGRRTTRRGAELRARDIVRRHGTGTLDYFALRDDKQWFFHRDSLVAYAVYGGVCLISPDPIGPVGEREHVWSAFRHHADRNGWAIGMMAAGEEWLPIYRASGMRYLYIGDEAVVDVTSFSLSGGKMKGLRQAVNRVERYGYRVHFYDPAHLPRERREGLADLMGRNRRGEAERGFSMTLGRMFDPRDTGLLLTVVDDAEGNPVAMCQFVPSPAIAGYSLDLMRRDPGEHPNGLLDFALCATIEHIRQIGGRAVSLNFAAMRSVLEGDTGDGVTQRVERWAIRRLSGVLQIESLWRFNAKYEPGWLPRYIVYDSAEQFVPTAVQIMRAESLTEIPVFGRLLNTSGASAASVSAAPQPDA